MIVKYFVSVRMVLKSATDKPEFWGLIFRVAVYVNNEGELLYSALKQAVCISLMTQY